MITKPTYTRPLDNPYIQYNTPHNSCAKGSHVKATVVRINRFGLCEVKIEEVGGPRRAGFTLDKFRGYHGQPIREFGIRKGAQVDLEEDHGRVTSARLVHAAAHP